MITAKYRINLDWVKLVVEQGGIWEVEQAVVPAGVGVPEPAVASVLKFA